MKKTSFNPTLIEKFTAKQFEKWFKRMGFDGDWAEVYKSLGGKIKIPKEQD